MANLARVRRRLIRVVVAQPYGGDEQNEENAQGRAKTQQVLTIFHVPWLGEQLQRSPELATPLDGRYQEKGSLGSKNSSIANFDSRLARADRRENLAKKTRLTKTFTSIPPRQPLPRPASPPSPNPASNSSPHTSRHLPDAATRPYSSHPPDTTPLPATPSRAH